MLHAEHIRAGRAVLKITQIELGEICGLNFNTIYRIEEKTGILSNSKLGTLNKIIEGFKKHGVTFVTRDDEIIIRYKPINPHT